MLCLTRPTDPRWASVAVDDLPTLLADHAHCEMKAATNALSLATRWPASASVARALTALAEEELRHFRAVIDELKPEVDTYAAELRKIALESGKKTPEGSLAERLLVGALIEARSCERFRLLAEELSARGEPLALFYQELLASEARHYRTLVDLAALVTGDERGVRERLGELSRAEGELIARFGVRATIHG